MKTGIKRYVVQFRARGQRVLTDKSKLFHVTFNDIEATSQKEAVYTAKTLLNAPGDWSVYQVYIQV